MTNKVQILLGDLKRETKRYQDLINAQTEKLTGIKNQIDLELQKEYKKKIKHGNLDALDN